MPESNLTRAALRRELTFVDAVSLGFGSIVGWAWLVLCYDWGATAGIFGAILAFGCGVILCIFVGLCYAELTPALPLVGGEIVFAFRSMGFGASWITGWSICFAYISVSAWEGIAMTTAVDYLFDLPKIGYLWTIAGADVYVSLVLFAAICAVLLGYINWKGIKIIGRLQVVATVLMSIGGFAFLICALIMGDPINLQPGFKGFGNFTTIVLIMPFMFVGFDVIPQAAEEMNIKLNRIGTAIIAAVVIAGCYFMLVVLATGFATTDATRVAGSALPAADAFVALTGMPWVGKALIVAGICGIITSWNGFYVGASRVLFSMGQARMIPARFGQVNPKTAAPGAALCLVVAFSAITPLLGRNCISWFVDAGALFTTIAYFMVCLSFCILRKKEPNLERPFKCPGGLKTGVIAVIITIMFLFLYTPLAPGGGLEPIEWAIDGVWVVLGIVFAVTTLPKQRNTPPQEREFLIMGAYARAAKLGKKESA